MLQTWKIYVFESYYMHILFGAETWIWTMSDIGTLMAAEMKFLRSIEGKTRREEVRNGKSRENL
jgi:hypothetical protein